MKDEKSFFNKFKEGKLFAFLKKSGSNILDIAGDITGVKALNKLGDLIDINPELSDEQKKEAIELYELEIKELDIWLNYNYRVEHELTERHKNDMTSDSWMSKNIRPMVLIFGLLCFVVLAILEASITTFSINVAYKEILKYIVSGTIAFYFIGREVQKYVLNNKK